MIGRGRLAPSRYNHKKRHTHCKLKCDANAKTAKWILNANPNATTITA